MSVNPHQVAATPNPVLATAIAEETVNPLDGGTNVHLAGQAGPLPPFTWTISANGSLAPAAWASTTGYSLGNVVLLPAGTYGGGGGVLTGAYALCVGAGTSGGSAPNSLGSAVLDGTATWAIVAAFANGLMLIPTVGSPSIGPHGGEIVPVPATEGLTMSSFSLPSSIYVVGAPFTLIVLGAP